MFNVEMMEKFKAIKIYFKIAHLLVETRANFYFSTLATSSSTKDLIRLS